MWQFQDHLRPDMIEPKVMIHQQHECPQSRQHWRVLMVVVANVVD